MEGDFAQILPLVCQGTTATIVGLAFNVLIFGLDFPFFFCGKIYNSSTMKTVENLKLGCKNCLIIYNGAIALACLLFYNKQAGWKIFTT